MYGEIKLGHVTYDTSRPSVEAGNGSSVASAEKVQLEDHCRAMMAAAACGQMVRTKKASEGSMLDTSDGHQRQKPPGNNDEREDVVRELNLAEGVGKEPRKGKKIGAAGVDGAAVSDRGQRGNNSELILVNEETPWVLQSSVGSSTERRYSRTRGLHPLADQNGVMSPRPGRSLPIGRARVTWRGATVDPTETWAIILKETGPGQSRSENKDGRSNLTPGSSLGGAKGSQDGTVIGSSHELPAAASNGKKHPSPSLDSEHKGFSSKRHTDHGPLALTEASGFKAAASNAIEERSSYGRRGSTSHKNLVKGELTLWYRRGQEEAHNRKAKTFWGEPKRGSRCSNDSEVLAGSLPADASNFFTRARPVYFQSTPYAGPQTASCPRAWPNGARALSTPSDAIIGEKATKGDREQGTIVKERSVQDQKEGCFPESKK